MLLFVLQDRFKPTKHEITLDPPLTSDEIEAFVSNFAQRYPRGYPLAESGGYWEAMRSAFGGVPIVSRDDVYERLDELGIGITGAARLDTGESLILPFKFGWDPIVLSQTVDLTGVGEKIELTVDSELGSCGLTYMTDSESWKRRGGRGGNACIKDGVITSLEMTVMN